MSSCRFGLIAALGFLLQMPLAYATPKQASDPERLTAGVRDPTGDTEISGTGRADQIRAQRSEKAGKLDHQALDDSSGVLTPIGHILQTVPVSFSIGGLGPGAGPAINFEKTICPGCSSIQVRGHLALHRFYSAGIGMELRYPVHDIALATEIFHSDAPQLEYYGPGPDSSIHQQTNFRREDTMLNGQLGFRLHRNVPQACHVGELFVNVGPGTNESLATTESVFQPDEAPGINVQSNYLIWGCSTALDIRDFPDDPHQGAYVGASFDRYSAENGSFSFNRLSLLGEEYISFFNRKRVIALRGHTELSFHPDDQVVPFYMQATLGSDTELRGFRRYRFYDENALALNSEYHWEIATGLDMALFFDVGTVFPRPGLFSLSYLKSSPGFGIRLKNLGERRLAARIDVGFSSEGFQVWLKTANLF